MTATPLRLDRLQQGLNEVLGSALSARYSPGAVPTLSWAYGEQSFESTSEGGLISLSILAGPTPLNRDQSRGTPLSDTESIEITVTAAAAEAYTVALNCYAYTHVSDGVESAEDIRDALLALIQDGEADYGSVTATASGADTILLTANDPGGLWSLEVFGPLTGGNRVDSGDLLLLTEGQVQLDINFQTFSKGRAPRNGAWDLTQTLMSALQTPAYVQQLTRWGIGLGSKGTPIDISQVDGGHWSTRTTFDVTMYMRSVWTAPVDRAQSISLTLNTQQPPTTTTVEIPL